MILAKRRILLFSLCCLLLLSCTLLFAGCRQSHKDSLQSSTIEQLNTANHPTSTEFTSPSSSLSPASTTAAPVLPAPSYASEMDEHGAVVHVTIDSSAGWNVFATDFNTNRAGFAVPLDVCISGMLSFDGMTFTTLADGFSGRIYGSERMESDPSEKGVLPAVSGSDGIYGGNDGICGFSDIRAVSDGRSLFGGQTGDLTVEDLSFCGISYTGESAPSNTWAGILCGGASHLTIQDVLMTGCLFRSLYEQAPGMLPAVPDCLLTGTADQLTLTRFYAGNCTMVGPGNQGLLFNTVRGDVQASSVSLFGCSVTGVYDDYGPEVSLFGFQVGGTAALERLCFYDCRTYGFNVSTFGWLNGISRMKDIAIEQCSLLAPHGHTVHAGAANLLFARSNRDNIEPMNESAPADLEEPMLDKIRMENVICSNSQAAFSGKDFDWYAKRGVLIENCLAVTDGPVARFYQSKH